MPLPPIDPELKRDFEGLSNDVTVLSWKWQILRTLFGTQEHLELLDKTAPNFFWVCERTLEDEIISSICRLTDSPKSRGHVNLIISRLKDETIRQKEPDFFRRLELLIGDVDLACVPFKEHRKKRLAHSDRETRLNLTPSVLPILAIDEYTKAVESLQKVINEFSIHFFESENSFEVVERRGVKSLLWYLRKGLDSSNAERDALIAQFSPKK